MLRSSYPGRRRLTRQEYRNNSRGYGNHGRHAKTPVIHMHYYYRLSQEQLGKVREATRIMEEGGLTTRLRKRRFPGQRRK